MDNFRTYYRPHTSNKEMAGEKHDWSEIVTTGFDNISHRYAGRFTRPGQLAIGKMVGTDTADAKAIREHTHAKYSSPYILFWHRRLIIAAYHYIRPLVTYHTDSRCNL